MATMLTATILTDSHRRGLERCRSSTELASNELRRAQASRRSWPAVRYFLPALEYGDGSIVFGVALFSATENDSASDGNAPLRTSAT